MDKFLLKIKLKIYLASSTCSFIASIEEIWKQFVYVHEIVRYVKAQGWPNTVCALPSPSPAH
jgi:hypothetical protein